MTWRIGPVGNEQRAITDDNGHVLAIAETSHAASKIVRALNDDSGAKRAAAQRDLISALIDRLETEEQEMQANMTAGTTPWVHAQQLSRADVIMRLQALLQGEAPTETRGTLVEVRFDPPAGGRETNSFSFVTRPGGGERTPFPPSFVGGTVTVEWA